MINWNTDEKTFQKLHPEEYKLWRLTQLINYGLDGKKLDEQEVKKAWSKIATIATLPRTRDYIDLYFILKKEAWTLNRLIVDCEKKFGERIDMLQLAKNFLKVSEYTDFPKMLIPFHEKDIVLFYQHLARTLKSSILR